MENEHIQFKEQLENDDFQVEYEIVQSCDLDSISDERIKSNQDAILSIEEKQKIIDDRLQELNKDIDRLTNHADGVDYTIAVACGVLCGIVDSLFVGEFDYEKALQKSSDKVSNYVKDKAEKVRTDETVQKAIARAKEKAKAKGKELSNSEIQGIKKRVTESIKNTFEGYENGDVENGTVNSLRRAITKLEGHYKISSDNMFKGIKGMNTASHHLDDMAHHPTLLGFCAAIVGEFFKAGVFVDKNGSWHLFVGNWDEEQKKKFFNLLLSIVIAASLRWILNSVTSKYKDEIDDKMPKPIAKMLHALASVPLALVVLKHCVSVFDNWWGHLASDMSGSNSTPGEGMGIPGLFLSILKEISSIPPLNMTSLPKVIDGLYTKQRFDMRAELAVINELGKQSIPVLLGDLLTRTTYFVRHLILELKGKNGFAEVDWVNVIPFNNRTITRLLLIESGTFTACDIADAAIRSAIKNGGNVYNPKLYTDFILRVNFVGIGKFAISIGSDIKMGADRKDDINERIFLQNNYLMLDNAIVSYKQGNVWIAAENTAAAISHMEEVAYIYMMFYLSKIKKLDENITELNKHIQQIKEANSDFTDEMYKLLN